MSDDVKAIESVDSPVVVLSDTAGGGGDKAPVTDQSEEGATDDSEYEAGLAQALRGEPEKKEPAQETDGGEKKAGPVRDPKTGKFQKKDQAEPAESGGEAEKETEGAVADEDKEFEERGKNLLEEEQREQEEEERQRQAEERKAGEKKADAPKRRSLARMSQHDAEVYLSFTNPDLFRDEKGEPVMIKVGNETFDLTRYVEDNPEVPIVAGHLMNNFLAQLIDAGILPSTDKLKKFGGEAWDSEQGVPGEIQKLRNEMFVLEIKAEGIKDPIALSRHEKFDAWHKAQKPAIQALFRSKRATDHALGWKRFQRDMKLPAAAKKEEADTKLRDKKEKEDALFGSTIKSTSKAPKIGGQGAPKGQVAIGPTEGDPDDYDGGFEEARKKHVR